jgi:hypothetical protein
MTTIFETYHNRAQSLFAEATSKDGLHYDGKFITGRLEAPDTLFLGINPGFGGEKYEINSAVFMPQDCKYIGETYLFAQRIVDVVMGGDESRLKSCAETSYRSFLATPDVKALETVLSQQDKEWRREHDLMMQDWQRTLIETIRPKRVICIGIGDKGPFHELLRAFKLDRNKVVEETLSEKSASGKSDPVFYKRATISGIPVHGVLHLSGAHPSAIMLKRLRGVFV